MLLVCCSIGIILMMQPLSLLEEIRLEYSQNLWVEIYSMLVILTLAFGGLLLFWKGENRKGRAAKVATIVLDVLVALVWWGLQKGNVPWGSSQVWLYLFFIAMLSQFAISYIGIKVSEEKGSCSTK